MHTVSNLEYAKLKLSDFMVKFQNCDPIIAIFDTKLLVLTFFTNFLQNVWTK